MGEHFDRFDAAWKAYAKRMKRVGKPQSDADKRTFLNGWLLGQKDMVEQARSDSQETK